MEVPIGPCRCPGTPHEQDIVTLRDTLSGAAGFAATRAYGGDLTRTETEDELKARGHARVLAYIEHSVTGWNLIEQVDGKDVAVPPTPGNVRRLIVDDWARVVPLTPFAIDLYEEAWADPLAAVIENSSPSGDGSISPNRSSRRKHRVR